MELSSYEKALFFSSLVVDTVARHKLWLTLSPARCARQTQVVHLARLYQRDASVEYCAHEF